MNDYAENVSELEDAVKKITKASMVNRWILVAEVINEEGERELHDLTSPGLAYWDVQGMTMAAAQGREAQPLWSIKN